VAPGAQRSQGAKGEKLIFTCFLEESILSIPFFYFLSLFYGRKGSVFSVGSEILRGASFLVTQDGYWLRAWDCKAGKVNDGNESTKEFAKFYLQNVSFEVTKIKSL
jgi:hypothetical protein